MNKFFGFVVFVFLISITIQKTEAANSPDRRKTDLNGCYFIYYKKLYIF